MSNENIEQQVKAHQKVYVALLVLTLVSAGAVMAGLSAGAAIVLVMSVAAIQGLLIALNVMHLKNEQGSMKGLFALCVFFIAFLVVATIIAYQDVIVGTENIETPPAVAAEAEEH